MPTFVIHELNKLARKVTVSDKTIRVGRDPHCQVVVNGAAVSREHAIFQLDASSSNWFVTNQSQTNPLVVDGGLVPESTWVKEGTEILIGADHLVVFSLTEQSAKTYFAAGRASFLKNRCPQCQWSGMVSALRQDPPCPRCGATGLVGFDTPQHKVVDLQGLDVSTRAMDLDQVRASLKQLHTAKKSHVERVDGWEGGAGRQDLSEATPLVIGRNTTMQLRGFVFGTVDITWNGRRYVVNNHLIFGGLRVNGEPTKSTPVKHGDILEIGSNRLKIVTE